MFALSSDLSIPVSKLYDIITDTRKRFEEAGLSNDSIRHIMGYGHVGDSNIHVNIVSSKWDKKVEEIIEPWIYQWVGKYCLMRQDEYIFPLTFYTP